MLCVSENDALLLSGQGPGLARWMMVTSELCSTSQREDVELLHDLPRSFDMRRKALVGAHTTTVLLLLQNTRGALLGRRFASVAKQYEELRADAALFDQFPHTPHAEVGVVLQRRRLTRGLTNSSTRGTAGSRWPDT